MSNTETIDDLTAERRALLALRTLRRRKSTRSSDEGSIPRLPREDGPQEFPLSFAQERLWFLDQLYPGNSGYNMPTAVRLRGRVNVAALEKAFNEIVRRHESLRTTFSAENGRPAQVVAPFLKVPLPVIDLRDFAEPEVEAQRLAIEEAQCPFVLSSGPLLRTTLLRLADEEYVALLTLHHIVSDNWSMGILVREMAVLYGAFASGRPSPLPEVTVQYADYAQWRRNSLQGEAYASQLDYWKRQLGGELPVLELPVDKPRPATPSFRGDKHEIALSKDLTIALKSIAERENATLYMVLLAAFQTLLSRYTGQKDICVGMPIANRQRREVENLIGFFVDTLVLRTDLSGNPTFVELLQRVREVALGAYSHQDLPFEKLVEELHVARDTGRQPLFQVMFVLQTAPQEAVDLPGLKIEPFDNALPVEIFDDLNLSLTETADGLSGTLEYSTELFEAETIARFVQHFERLLQSIAGAPATRLLELPLLSEAEQARVLEGFNAESQAAREAVAVAERFAQQAAKTPEAPALIFGERVLSYAELETQSNQLAHYLRGRGAGLETVVAIKLDRSAEMFVALLAVLKTGAAYLPLDPGYPAERLAFMCADAQPRLLLTEARYAAEASGAGEVICLEEIALAEYATESLGVACASEALAYVIYTSGSTGRPKGVCVTHRVLTNLLAWHSERLLGGVPTLGFASLSFDASVHEAFAAWCTGGALVVAGDEERQDAEALARLIAQQQVAKAILPVVMLQQLAESEAGVRQQLSTLREVTTTGEQLRITRAVRGLFAAELRACELHNHYGPSETHVVTAKQLGREPGEWAAHPSIGLPVAGARLYVLDEQLRPVPEGVRGEVYIGGAALGRGYWQRAALTAERFIPDPFATGGRLYRTGDVGRWRAGGELEYEGRVDQQVKVRGYRIEPGEIEAVLRAAERVSEAVVVAREGAGGEKRLVGYVVPAAGATVTMAELRARLRRELPEYMVPGVLVVLERLPLTPSGKLDRGALPAVEGQSPGAEYEAARTPIEEVLCGIWAEVLRVERVGINDDFFALGGDSLLAMRIVGQARRLGLSFTPKELFDAPAIARLAGLARITAPLSVDQDYSSPDAESVERSYPLSPLQQGMLFHSVFAPGSGEYVEQFCGEWHGPFDVEAFATSWREVIARHTALRTAFFWENLAEPRQVVFEKVELPLEQFDWRDKSVTEQEHRLREYLREQQETRVIDPSRAPLMRLALFRLGDEHYRFAWSYHHLLLDGWSQSIVLKEVRELYAARCERRDANLSTTRPYSDFIAWQNAQDLAKAEAFWRDYLKGFSAPTSLPGADVRFRRTHEDRFKQQQAFLSEETTAALESLARQHRLTLVSLVQGVWAILLSRYTRAEDVLFGSIVSGRSPELADVEKMVGLFINTLPMRVWVDGNARFIEWVKGFQSLQTHAREYEYSPLVQVQRWSDVPAGTRLFEHFLVFENYPGGDELWPGEDIPALRTGYPLYISVKPGKALSLKSIYSNQSYSDEAIRRLLGHFARLLEAVVQEPEQELGALPLLTAVERQALCWDDNATERDWPLDIPFHVQFEKQVAATPAATAVRCERAELSYRELAQAMDATAAKLCASGLQQGEVVGLLADRGSEYVAALLGIMKAGGVYLPLDPQHPAVRQERLLQRAAVKLVLCAGEYEELLAGAAQVRVLDYRVTEAAAWTTDEAWSNDEVWDASDLAYVIFTSGSTGEPKGAMIEQRGMLNHLHAKCEDLQLSARDVVAQNAPQGFDISIWQMLAPLLVGARVEVFSAAEARDPEALLRGVEARGVTVLETVPAMMRAMLEWSSGQAARPELRQLRYVISNAEALSVELAERWLTVYSGPELLNTWGATECSDDVTHERVVKGRWPGLAYVPLGQRLGNIRVYIVDGRGELVPVGVVGELLIGGVSVGRGYLGDAERTRVSFINDYLRGDGARLYRTGDLGRWLSDGSLEFVGRVDEQVKVRGYRVEPGEVEAVLRGQAGVSEAVVVARATGAGEARLVGYVVCEAGRERSGAELRAALRGQLPEYLVPSAVVVLAELPLNANGKVDKRALPEPEYEADEESYEAPRTAVEEVLCGIWSEVLGVARVGINDNFFELGGHSLLATQVMSRVRVALGVEVALRVLFEVPTVAALARAVEGELSSGAGESAPPLLPVSREGALPLSFAQQRLWFIDQLDPDSFTYNISALVRMQGDLNVEALEATLGEIIRRHESLRTVFPTVDGEPKLLILPAEPVHIPIVDLRGPTEIERDAEAQQIAIRESQRPFNLAEGPLFRVSLFKLGEREHMFLLVMHHIVSDGWSIGLLIQEVAALYEAFSNDRPSPLPELAIQYVDYAAWQRNWLAGDVLNRELSYWKQQLEGAPALLELPTDHPRSNVQTGRGTQQFFTLPAELTARLRELSHREGTTLFMTLMAAYQALLYRYSKQKDILVGTPIANRTNVETEPLIGFFVNMLVLRSRLNGETSFSELLQQVRENTLHAYQHQEVPFEQVVEALQPERSLSHTPLFQVIFALQNAPQEELQLAGLRLTPVEGKSATAKYDLNLSIMEAEGELQGMLEYSTELFEAATIEQMLIHFEQILRSVVKDANQHLSELELLSAAEQQRQLVERNASGAGAVRDECIAELFAVQAAQQPEQLAVVCGEQRWSYAELDHRSNQLARHLRGLGVGPEVVVGVMMERSAELVVSLLAILKAGGAYLALEAGYPLERLSFMLADAGVPVILTQEHLSEELPAHWAHVVCVDTEWEQIAQESGAALAALPMTADALAYISYTSGTTGKPKGVGATQRGVVRLAHQPEFIEVSAADRFLLLAPVSFDASTLELWSALLNGACLVVAPAATPSLAELGGLLQREQVSVLWLTAGLFQVMVEERVAELAGVRELLAGGDVVAARAVRQFLTAAPQSRFSNGYGPTENTTFTCCHAVTTAAAVGATVPIGRPIRGTQVYVLDEELRLVPEGVVGELYTGGAGLARGYVQAAGVTAERFVPHPYSAEPGARLYRTGDLVRWNRAGELEFVGRVDQQVKVRGFRVELGEVETALRSHGQVSEAVVVAQAEASGAKRLVGYVVANEELSGSELRAYLAERLPEYMVPSGFVQLAALPLTANGKVDRRALPAYEQRLSERCEYEAPRTPVEEVLCGIWAEVLKAERVGIQDNFFGVGGHSLLASQLVSRLSKTFELDLSLRHVFMYPTVSELALQIEELLLGQIEQLTEEEAERLL